MEEGEQAVQEEERQRDADAFERHVAQRRRQFRYNVSQEIPSHHIASTSQRANLYSQQPKIQAYNIWAQGQVVISCLNSAKVLMTS